MICSRIYCSRPRFIITTMVISGMMLTALPLLRHVSPLLSLEGQGEEYQSAVYSVGHQKSDKYSVRSSRNVHRTSDDDELQLPVSLSPDIDTRSRFQKAQVKKYCEKYNMPDAIPHNHTIVNEAWKRMVIDTERKILFCLAPKLASTNIRLLFAALNNVIDPSEEALEKYMHSHDSQAFRYRMHMSAQSKGEREKKLASFFKFVMTRNPLERILSAYRNKLENHPINPKVTGLFDRAKIEMIKTYRPRIYSQWEESGRTIKVFPTFNEFIRYLNSHSYYELDPHFRPLQYVCHPCVFQYDFYANLKLMPEEFDRLFKKFNIPHESFRDQPAHHDTGSLMPKYFAKLSKTEKKMVYNFVHQELEFYYHIYPEERNMHIPLIGQFE